MNLKAHFIVSLVLSIALFPFFGIYALLALVTGFLIDIDHWLGYALKFNDWNPFNSFRYFKNCDCAQFKEGKFGFIVLFHSVEFLIVMIVISIFIPLIWIAIGSWLIHIIMDLVYESQIKVHKIYSIILFYIDNT